MIDEKEKDLITRTVVLPVFPDNNISVCMSKAINSYTNAWNYIVQKAWGLKSISKKSIHKEVYYNVREKFELPSQLTCSVISRAKEAIKAVKARIRKKRKASVPSSNCVPIRLDARSMSLNKDKTVVSFLTNNGRVKLPLFWNEYAKRYKEWNCSSGEFSKNHRGIWVIRLHMQTNKPRVDLTGVCVGIDRGIKHPAVTSDNRFLGMKWWQEHERRLLSLKAKLQSKGTKSSKRRLKKLSGRLRRFKTDCDYVIAKKLLSKLNAGDSLVLESLTNIRENIGKKGKSRKRHRSHVARWSFKRLENCLTSLAELLGISIDKVPAHYTSQKCSGCSKVLKNNRKSQSLYKCNCGLTLNADLNAARNIKNLWFKAKGFELRLQSMSPM